MEYLVILILLAIAVIYFLRKTKAPSQEDDTDAAHVEATFICDECGERECICREEKKE